MTSPNLLLGSPRRKIARLTEDMLSPSSSYLGEETLQWEGVVTSILGVEDISSDHDDEVHSDDILNVLGQQLDDTVNTSPERSALADLGRRIETWAERTMNVHKNSTT